MVPGEMVLRVKSLGLKGLEFQVFLMAENGLGLVFQLGSLVLLVGEVERLRCSRNVLQNGVKMFCWLRS